ncbi:hypothetical protein M426DRAFT_216766 [Hypoxylon sp. CI-4A]|nr:hypothetical protein M426DRAFT_216766 [Hypoxylon sp. CI-4A]
MWKFIFLFLSCFMTGIFILTETREGYGLVRIYALRSFPRIPLQIEVRNLIVISERWETRILTRTQLRKQLNNCLFPYFGYQIIIHVQAEQGLGITSNSKRGIHTYIQEQKPFAGIHTSYRIGSTEG